MSLELSPSRKPSTVRSHRYRVRVEVFAPDGHLVTSSATEGELHAPNLRSSDEMIEQACGQAAVDRRQQ